MKCAKADYALCLQPESAGKQGCRKRQEHTRCVSGPALLRCTRQLTLAVRSVRYVAELPESGEREVNLISHLNDETLFVHVGP